LSDRERQLTADPKEQEVRAVFRQRADEYSAKLKALPRSWEEGRIATQSNLETLSANGATFAEIKAASRALAAYPKSAEAARRKWQEARDMNLAYAAPVVGHTTPYPGSDEVPPDVKRNNFLALALCLMMGTAALPHLLSRFYVTPSVQQARSSVFWALLFIVLIYSAVPALAVLVKYDIYTSLVGIEFSKMPAWVSYWASIDKSHPLVNIVDINRDGIVQLAEIFLDGDVVVLATPEIAGLPYVISGLIAAGGLAAALSTADGLLLTISNALSHDVYYKVIDPRASSQKRVTISKLLLLVVALVAAYAASLKPGNILSMVGVAFSLASSILFAPLVLGIFWKRANQQGALAGMAIGLAVCVYYMAHTHPALGGSASGQWFNIAPISAGVFGVPAATLAIIIVSLLTDPPDARTHAFVDYIRTP
ncbi:MAG: cation acetate symporter, partial [Noviherbaspirillum sp.]|nr:cation acetate symporter [Noviherbaspirillum sp.]